LFERVLDIASYSRIGYDPELLWQTDAPCQIDETGIVAEVVPSRVEF